ncbi:hypothetical protein FRB94_010485 [Tulasnella sp. JGI-2019a]|nr:hypothetical protein FRB94_010485 [Tulasnella sp. JGI-2019a]
MSLNFNHLMDTTAPICRLPTDILLTLVHILVDQQQHQPRQQGLLPLLHTCRVMRDVVEPFIYQDIKVDWKRRSGMLLLRTLVDRPDLAQSVTAFDGYLITDMEDNDDGAMWSPRQHGDKRSYAEVVQFKILLTQAINGMKNLRSLRLRESEHYLEPLSLGGPIQYPGHFHHAHLTSLNIGGRWCHLGWVSTKHLPAQTTAATRILSIIRNQPLLEYLRLPMEFCELVKEPFLPTDIPQLRSLCASADDAGLIVPGRPVTRLQLLHPPTYSFRDTWKDLGRSTKPLRDLTIQFFHPALSLSDQLPGMITHLPQLETLTILGVIIDYYHAIVNDIPLFANLHTLNLHIDYMQGMSLWEDLQSKFDHIRVSVLYAVDCCEECRIMIPTV